ncbi:MAG: glycerate kinase, partial [Candidatus Actinomarina sp.]|nr:glycerate kinase [Candidatus Actinomarina sp.]
MRINVYSDKFSGTLSAAEVLKTVSSAFKDVDIQANYFPVTDGGEHSTQILKHYNMKTEMISMTRDFIGNSIPVEYLNVDNDIYFESASLIGVNKTSDHPFNLDTSALAEVIPNIDVLSLGGSKTVDGGVGLMSSLGIEFYTEENIITNPKPRDFKDITAVKIADSFANLELRVLTDTSIPLLGSNSAVATYGPQKGLDKKDI